MSISSVTESYCAMVALPPLGKQGEPIRPSLHGVGGNDDSERETLALGPVCRETVKVPPSTNMGGLRVCLGGHIIGCALSP
jgi:hypothetical protein